MNLHKIRIREKDEKKEHNNKRDIENVKQAQYE